MRTVFEAAGGIDGLRRLAAAWHRRVMADEVVGHAFSHDFHPQRVEHLAAYSAEALGGPSMYSKSYGEEDQSPECGERIVPDAVRTLGGWVSSEHGATASCGLRCVTSVLADQTPSVAGRVHAAATLIMWKMGRLGDSLRDLITMLDDLKQQGVTLRSLTEAIDTECAC